MFYEENLNLFLNECEFHLIYRYHDQYPCPKGYYRNETQGMSVDECYPCPGGQYCEYEGLFEPTGDCDPGKNYNAILHHFAKRNGKSCSDTSNYL